MSHTCHRFWKCYKILTFCSPLARCRIPCACHPQRHLNIQKWSEDVVVLNILTWKCASRHNCVHFLDISTSKSAPNVRCFCFFPCNFSSRHNGVQLFISHLPGWLRTCRFSEPTFQPSAHIIGTTQWIATFLPFRAPASSFFSLFLFSDLSSSALLLSDSSHLCFFHLSILSEVRLLNFLRWLRIGVLNRFQMDWDFQGWWLVSRRPDVLFINGLDHKRWMLNDIYSNPK